MARVKAFDENMVLDKAVELFWHKGYNATSAQDLVEKLSISRSSLYDTYGDKHNLFIAALKQYESKYTQAIVQLSEQEGSAVKTIKQLFKGLVQEGLSDALSKGCFMVNTAVELAPHDSEIATIVNHNMQTAEDAFYTIIKRGQANGELSTNIQARAMARFLFNNVTGLRVAIRTGKDKKYLDDIVNILLTVL